jgi:hypothetical protein
MDKRLHPKKQYSQMTSTLGEIQINDREEQFLKAYFFIRLNIELASNVTMDNLLHSEKQYSGMSSKKDGIRIDCKEGQILECSSKMLKSLSIWLSLDSGSNAMVDKLLHLKKQLA